MIKRKEFKPEVESVGYHSPKYRSNDSLDTLTDKLNQYITENNVKVFNVETFCFFKYEDRKFHGIRLWYTELKSPIKL